MAEQLMARKGASLAAAPEVKRLGEEVLAGPALALEEDDRRLALGQLPDHHPGAAA